MTRRDRQRDSPDVVDNSAKWRFPEVRCPGRLAGVAHSLRVGV
jgi:hypothetical protein